MGGFSMRQLGKTGLLVSPVGIGGGSGIQSNDALYAFERGINYFFFSSDLHHFAYQRSVEAIKTLCSHGSSTREKVVLATVSYVNRPEKLSAILIDQLGELGVDYIDIFHWGWITDDDDCQGLFQAAHNLKTENDMTRMFRRFLVLRNQTQEMEDEPGRKTSFARQMEMQERAASINEGLLKSGIVRYVGASFHSRRVARQWMDQLDVMMLRYNIMHTGVEQDIVPYLAQEKARNPGIVVFNVAHEGIHIFDVPPQGYPVDAYVPSIPDCYRFALTNSWADLVLAGLQNKQQIDLALEALEKGPLSEQEYARIREYGLVLQSKAGRIPKQHEQAA